MSIGEEQLRSWAALAVSCLRDEPRRDASTACLGVDSCDNLRVVWLLAESTTPGETLSVEVLCAVEGSEVRVLDVEAEPWEDTTSVDRETLALSQSYTEHLLPEHGKCVVTVLRLSQDVRRLHLEDVGSSRVVLPSRGFALLLTRGHPRVTTVSRSGNTALL